MGELKVIKKDGLTNPLKKSPLLGATLAMLGIDKTLILHHGCQGCTAFTKNILTDHFNEVIPLQTTATVDIATIMGKSNIPEALNNSLKNKSPEIISILGTTLVETRGDDVKGELNTLNDINTTSNLIYINCSDTLGDAELGFSKATKELIINFAEKRDNKNNKKINILTNFSMTCGDIIELKEIIKDFNLEFTILPDISFLSGSNGSCPTLTKSSTTLDDIKQMGDATSTICIGQSMLNIAKYLEEQFNIPYYFLPSLTGIKYTDLFLNILEEISGNKRDVKYVEQRNMFVDAMLDCHFYTTNKYVSVATEPDLLFSLSYFLVEEMGLNLEAAITTNDSDIIEMVPTHEIYIGDIEDAEREIVKSEILISNTNALLASTKKNISLYLAGFPVKNRLGYHLKEFIGYKGSMNFLFEITNILYEKEEEESMKKII
ncbi:MAG: nitrogenase iron-molybdenum cofactor biosynthesis protein NifN [Deferribacterota bacterium]|nr:nitrogenase iron-molybdenum cofactor biosynthesis protein NifN [Deferribacterota bacterium]